MTLYEECISKLGTKASILTEELTNKIIDSLQEVFPFTFYGRIDWEKVKRKETKFDTADRKLEAEEVYILWDNAMYPALRSDFNSIIQNVQYVTRVSFDTWIYAPSKYVIEFYHEEEITIGYCN